MQSSLTLSKAPAKFFGNFGLFKLLKLFKYEIIKILVFLVVFFASVYYVNAESEQFYKNHSVYSQDK
jgi:hypothetical protein